MRYKSPEMMDRIVAVIEDFFLSHYRPPSVMEIAEEVGRAKSSVHAYLRELDRLGRISYRDGVLETPVMRKTDVGMSFSPLLGSIACGEPQYEEENYEAYIALPDAIFGREPHFILRAKGESMIEAGIEPGDFVVVRKQSTAREGDIVVALIDGETTLKRFYLDEEHKCIRLHPENCRMEDIYVDHCYIQGVAQNVIKNLEQHGR